MTRWRIHALRSDEGYTRVSTRQGQGPLPFTRAAVRGSLVVVLVASVQTAVAQEPLGRLFFTPAERARLDASREVARANALRPRPEGRADVTVPESLPQAEHAGPRTLTLNGLVRRSDGSTVVWINGRAATRKEGEVWTGVAVDAGGRRVPLRVGQTVETASGVVEEGYRRRRTLAPAAPVPAAEAESGIAAPREAPKTREDGP